VSAQPKLDYQLHAAEWKGIAVAVLTDADKMRVCSKTCSSQPPACSWGIAWLSCHLPGCTTRLLTGDQLLRISCATIVMSHHACC